MPPQVCTYRILSLQFWKMQVRFGQYQLFALLFIAKRSEQGSICSGTTLAQPELSDISMGSSRWLVSNQTRGKFLKILCSGFSREQLLPHVGIWAPDPMEKIVYITAQLLIPLCLYWGLNLALGGWRCFLGPAVYKADVLWMLLEIVLMAVISGEKIQGHRWFPQISCCLWIWR